MTMSQYQQYSLWCKYVGNVMERVHIGKGTLTIKWRNCNHGCGAPDKAFLPSHLAIKWRHFFSHDYGIVDKAFYLAMQLTKDHKSPPLSKWLVFKVGEVTMPLDLG